MASTAACASDRTFMRRALDEAKRSAGQGNLGVGAIVVLENKVVACGGNEVVSSEDPFAHAEVQALRDFIQQNPEHLLNNAILYTTFEPCPMCLGACMVLGVGTIVVGGIREAQDTAWGGYRPEAFADLVGLSGPRIQIRQGPYTSECVLVRAESLERAGKPTMMCMVSSEDKE